MNDPGLDGWKIASVTGWGITTILGWLGVRYVNRIDWLRDHAITREEFEKYTTRRDAEQTLRHGENRDSLLRIEQKIDGTQAAGVVVTRLDRTENDIERLKLWQESEGMAYIRATDELKVRMDAVEKRQQERMSRERRR